MKKTTILCVLILFFISCGKDNVPSISLKLSKNDPFKSSIVKSQFFEINNKKDTVIIGKQGTKIVIPKNAFIDEKGNPITKNVKVELAEAYLLSDIILSNLTTTSNGKLLETDGMIFINATQKGKNLKIDKTKPLYIEMPTKKKKANMKLYDGIRDENGNMNWINPKPLKNYLIPIDLDLLDFLPDGFENEAINYLNFHQIKPTKKAIDSLYYNLPITKESLNYTENYFFDDKNDGIQITKNKSCGIEPSVIQTIKSAKFNNTLISTKEFEERMWYLHKLCSGKYLEFYVENLKKNLWEIDKMILDSLRENSFVNIITTQRKINRGGGISITIDERKEFVTYKPKENSDTIGLNLSEGKSEILKKFIEFKNQKLTNVKEKSIYINQLKEYYHNKLTENIKKSNKLRLKTYKKEQNSGIRQAYKELIWERERIAMESYGFELTEFGWKNIDKNIISNSIDESQEITINRISLNYQTTNVAIQNKMNFNQIYVYLVYPKIKSIVRLDELEKNKFTLLKIREFPVPINAKIQVITIAYKNDKTYFNNTFFNAKTKNSTENNISMLLKEISQQNIDKLLKFNETYDKSQQIKTDVNFSQSIAKDKDLKLKLLEKAMPCCNFNSKNKRIIKSDTTRITTAVMELNPE